MSKIKSTLLCLVVSLQMGCSFVSTHQLEITQGNHFDADALAQLRLGMTAKQVAYLLGSPAIDQLYADQRWDYLYYRDDHKNPVTNQRLSLWFDQNGLLSRARSNFYNVENIQPASANP